MLFLSSRWDRTGSRSEHRVIVLRTTAGALACVDGTQNQELSSPDIFAHADEQFAGKDLGIRSFQ
jgi:hypothetical protein